MIGVYLLLVLATDLRTRRYPLWLIVLAVPIAMIEGWSWWGMVVGLGLGAYADVPGGDLKFLGIFGGLVGMPIIAWTLFGAFGLTWLAWRKGLTGVPWTVYIGLAYPWTVIVQSVLE